jgi:hypothetical protein
MPATLNRLIKAFNWGTKLLANTLHSGASIHLTPRSAANLERSGKFVRQQRFVTRQLNH